MINHSSKMHFHIQEVAIMVSVPVIVKTSMMVRSGNRNRGHYGTPNATKISCLCRLDHSSSSRLCRIDCLDWSAITGTYTRVFKNVPRIDPGNDLEDVSRIDSGNDLKKVLSREFKFWSRGPKFSLENVVHLVKNQSGLKMLILSHLSPTGEYKMTANQRMVSVVTLNAPGEVSNKTKLL